MMMNTTTTSTTTTTTTSKKSIAERILFKIASNFIDTDKVFHFLVNITKQKVCLAGGAVLYGLHSLLSDNNDVSSSSSNNTLQKRFPLKDVDLFMQSPSKERRKKMFESLLEAIKNEFPDCKMIGHEVTEGLFVPVIDIFLNPNDKFPIQMIGGWCHSYSGNVLYDSVDSVLNDFSEDYVKCAIYNDELIQTPDCKTSLENSTVFHCSLIRTSRAVRAIQKGFSMPLCGSISQICLTEYDWDDRRYRTLDYEFKFDNSKNIIPENHDRLLIDYVYDTVDKTVFNIGQSRVMKDDKYVNKTNEVFFNKRFDTFNLYIKNIGNDGLLRLTDGKETYEEVRWCTTRIIVLLGDDDKFETKEQEEEEQEKRVCYFELDETCPWSQWVSHVGFEFFETDKKACREWIKQSGHDLGNGRWLLTSVRVQIVGADPNFITGPYENARQKYGFLEHIHTYIGTISIRQYKKIRTRIPANARETTVVRRTNNMIEVLPYMSVVAVIHPQYASCIIPLLPKFSIFGTEKHRVEHVCQVLFDIAQDYQQQKQQQQYDVVNEKSPLPLFVMVCIVLKDTQFRYRHVNVNGKEPLSDQTVFAHKQ